MRSVTATHVARNFARVLDEVENGEELLITRDGKAVARMAPETRTSADRLAEVFSRYPPDPDFADDIELAVKEMREFFVDDITEWPEE